MVEIFDIAQHFLDLGGWVMWPLAATSLTIWFVLAYRVCDIYRHTFSDEAVIHTIGRKLSAGETVDSTAELVCMKGIERELFRMLATEFSLSTDGRETIRRLVGRCQSQMRTDKLLVRCLIQAAPLLGLLGTVTGMIETFHVIETVGITAPTMLAAGISKAMITTQAGLLIAVPSIFVEKQVSRREDWICYKLEETKVLLTKELWS